MLEPGEVRARQVQCSDELIADGEARIGDWLIENAVARFGLRGSYSALYALDEDGGTLVDAVTRAEDGTESADALAELRVTGDRSTVRAENEDGLARLVLPGMTWTLLADDPVLRLDAPALAVVQPEEGVERTGTSWAASGTPSGFLGTDGTVDDAAGGDAGDAGDTGAGDAGEATGSAGAGARPTATLTLSTVTADPESWTRARFGTARPVAGRADADTVAVLVDGVAVSRLPVTGEAWAGFAPAGAKLLGERPGCTYGPSSPEGPILRPITCAGLELRVRDEVGEPVAGAFTDAATGARTVLPRGGGTLALGPQATSGRFSAGPAWSEATLDYAPGAAATLGLTREMDTDGAVLADLRREALPDPDAAWQSVDALHDATGDGVAYAVLYADDELPTVTVSTADAHDGLLAVSAVRSHCLAPDGTDGGSVISWPWTANNKRPAHGVPPSGLSALDLLTVARGNSADRRTLVDAAWVRTALLESPGYAWPDEPLGVWLDGPDDVDAYLDLLSAFVNVTPVGPRTWIELPTGDHNVPGVEAGLYDGATTAGTGARIEVHGGLVAGEYRVYDLEVDAPRRMGIGTVTLIAPSGTATFNLTPWGEPYGGGWVRVRVPTTLAWVVATVEGESGDWAVRGVW